MTRFRVKIVALGCALLVSGCDATSHSTSSSAVESSGNGAGSTSCRSLFNTILSRERAGDTAGAINAELDALSGSCPGKYKVFVDYASIKATAAAGSGGACSAYADYRVQPEAITLARRDGYCSGPATARKPARRRVDPGGVPEWSCTYSPTVNNNWHDDVSCSNGLDQHRPHLRDWDSFVTQAEIMASAREYEQHLNSS